MYQRGLKSGFTLVEILLVVAAIAILAGVVIVAINPLKQLAETRNAQRYSDVDAILEAVFQYTIDNGELPDQIDGNAGVVQVLGTATGGCDSVCGAKISSSACLDLSYALEPDYLVDMPVDPKTGSASISDYYIDKTSTDRIEVGACDPERSVTIKATR